MEDSIGDWLAGSSAFGMSRMAVVFDFNRDRALIRSLGVPEGCRMPRRSGLLLGAFSELGRTFPFGPFVKETQSVCSELHVSFCGVSFRRLVRAGDFVCPHRT
jgi:hypothetical protein